MLVAAALGATSAAAREGIMARHVGACDGSAGVALGGGRFASADDDANLIGLYDGAAPRRTLDLRLWLGTDKKKKPDADGEARYDESDIEGAARQGDLIYWIGSHGRDGEGREDEARARFFATRATQPGPMSQGLEPVGTGPYRGLRDDMLASPELASLDLAQAYRPGKKKGPSPEDDVGFNIEGLAAWGADGLLIGLRNPRPMGKAALVPFLNPREVVERAAKARFAAPILLDLGGRGVRSVERVGEAWLIVAGPHGDAWKGADPFLVYRWAGAGAKPEPLDWRMPEGFRPEGLFASPDGATITLLSDDGTKACKKAASADKSFRSLTFPAPR
jgi:hypothetical protein